MTIQTVGGYRVVRKLGGGARADVYLGYPEREGSTAVVAAIKVFHPGVTQESAVTEIEALSRAWGDHVVELFDLSSGPDGASAVLMQRLTGGSLSRLLQDRPSLRMGEAVTILAPVVTTVARLHAAGVTHGRLGGDSVLFDSTGAPVLACFGSARLISPGLASARLEAEPAVLADMAAVAALVATVLGRVHSDAAFAVASWAQEGGGLAPDRWLAELARKLFECAESEPVAFGRVMTAPPTVPTRLVTGELADVPAATSARAALALPEWIERYLPDSEVVQRVRTVLGSVRPRLWIVAGAVAVGLVAALLLIPSRGSDATANPSASTPSPSPTTAAPAVDAAVVGDDPVPALHTLLEMRERCIRDLSLLCLDAVDQTASAALDQDREAVRAVQEGGEVPIEWTVKELTLTERLGGSAIIAVDEPGQSEPASFLLVKGEAGWRIRDYLWQ